MRPDPKASRDKAEFPILQNAARPDDARRDVGERPPTSGGGRLFQFHRRMINLP